MNHRVAIISTDYWGKNLVRNYHQLGALKIVCGITVGCYAFVAACAGR